MIDGQNIFDQPIRRNLVTYGNIRKEEMIIQLVVCQTVTVSKINTR